MARRQNVINHATNNGKIDFSGITADRTYALPDRDGTLADTAYVDSAGSNVLVIEYGTDATAEIQAAVDSLPVGGVASLLVRRQALSDAVYINGVVQVEADNVTLEFLSPISYGPLGSVRIRGSQDEHWNGPSGENTGTIPALLSDATVDGSGRLVLPLKTGDGAKLNVGAWVVVRGLRDADGSALEKQYGEILSIVGDTITLTDPPLYTFLETYPDGGTTNVRMVRSAELSSSASAGAISVVVSSVAGFSVGDICQVADARVEADVDPDSPSYTNDARTELARISDVDGGTNTISFDAPLQRDYSTAWNARVYKVLPVYNSHIKTQGISWAAPQTTRIPALQVDWCVRCTIHAGDVDGTAGRIGQGVRISNSYDCHARGGLVRGAYSYGSGEAYGATMYYSTQCSIRDMTLTAQRHGILMQGSTRCDVMHNVCTDSYINGLDTHGVSSVGCRILHNKVINGPNIAPATTNKMGIRVGNTSHIIPDVGTIVEGNYVEGFSGPNDFGADVVAPSSNAVFRNNVFRNCNVGITKANNSGSVLGTKTIDRLTVDANVFDNCGTAVDIAGNATGEITDLNVTNNVTLNCTAHFVIDGVAMLDLGSNTILSPASGTATGYDLYNLGGGRVSLNQGADLDVGAHVENCTNLRVTKNDFSENATAVVQAGTNTGLVIGDNDLLPQHPVEKYASAIAASFTSTTVLPHDNSVPLISEGDSIITATVPTTVGKPIKMDVVIPYAEITTSGAVSVAVFADTVCIAAFTYRVTTGGSSGGGVSFPAYYTPTDASTSVDVRIGPAVANTITLNQKFGGLANPYLLVTR